MTTIDYDIYRPGVKRLVFMVSNRNFPNPADDRQSAVMDDYYNVFKTYFGFDTCCRDKRHDIVINANYSTLEKELDYVRNILDTDADVGCLAVILSSHGMEEKHVDGVQKEHFIFCSDGKPFKTLDIIKRLQTNIPVIFVIQACRDVPGAPEENCVDRGVSIRIVQDQSMEKSAGAGFSSYKEEKASTLVPACAPHTCVFFSSSEGKEAYRDGIYGGWLLDNLDAVVKNMRRSGETEISLFDLFTHVNSKMSKNEGEDKYHFTLKSASSFLHQMTQKLILKFK